MRWGRAGVLPGGEPQEGRVGTPTHASPGAPWDTQTPTKGKSMGKKPSVSVALQMQMSVPSHKDLDAISSPLGDPPHRLPKARPEPRRREPAPSRGAAPQEPPVTAHGSGALVPPAVNTRIYQTRGG